MNQALSIQSMTERLHQDAKASRQRRLLVLSGSRSWCLQQTGQVLDCLALPSVLWVGQALDGGHALAGGCGSLIKTVVPAQARQWLGQESQLVLFNAWDGFDVDAFGALSGTVKAGGLLLLLTPPLAQWPAFQDPEHRRIAVYPQGEAAVGGRYLARLTRLIKARRGLSFLDEDGDAWLDCPPVPEPSVYSDAQGCLSSEQADAVAAIKKTVRGRRKSPLVLTADRGRGKSAALGIAAAQLIQEGLNRIIVTAPAEATVATVFHHGRGVGEAGFGEARGELIFRAPDELVRQPETCDLLLVDEAAAIPAPLLEKLLSLYSRIVFCSTVHGYEGTGRGFAVRFRHTLDRLTPRWRALHLHTPVRWAGGDPLESFTFAALMLKASPASREQLALSDGQADWQLVRLDRQQLAADDRLLAELFGLLVLAHYQTRPLDLRHLLDGANIEIYTLMRGGHILATALLATEGAIEPGLEEPIWRGQRRVRGHLMPQSLSYHLGLRSAVRLKGGRVIRIAVHPDYQRQGLGLALLAKIRQLYASQLDYLGSLFGATPGLLAFWRCAGLEPVRLGLNREAASGAHSVMMIDGLSPAGIAMAETARQRFGGQLHALLTDALRELEADVAWPLLEGLKVGDDSATAMTSKDWQDLQAFARGERLYESCLVAVKKWLCCLLAERSSAAACLDSQQQQLLVGKVLQGRSWTEIAALVQLAGRNQVQAALRKACAASLA